MPRAMVGAAAMLALFAFGVSAQTHSHGAAAGGAAQADTTQRMMQQHMSEMQQRMQSMDERMQSMQEQMRSMHQMMQGMGQGDMQMRGMQMRGMQMDGRPGSSECLASEASSGLAAVLMGPVSGLALTPDQMLGLRELLTRAQTEATELLTGEQLSILEAAGPLAAPCAPAEGMAADAPHQ